MNLPPLAIGCDHAGFEYKELIKRALQDEGYTVHDKGTHSLDSGRLSRLRASRRRGGGVGRLPAGHPDLRQRQRRRHHGEQTPGIRAAIAWRNDVAALARQHNDANILCLPARFITIDEAQQFVRTFLATAFEGGRHAQRVGKIPLQHCASGGRSSCRASFNKHGTQTLPGRRLHRPALRRQSGRGDAAARGAAGSAHAKHRGGEQPERDRLPPSGRSGGEYHIRWFTPAAEINLCGHATLASAWVVFNKLGDTARRWCFI